ncbi:MAG: copper resistance protein CopZ [Rhodanobacter sp. 67-28]|uniref:heavy-metal-associated domain-containing protein n=1 Tax=Rhodanobacter sp. FW021-MT20 TaxID=1162282 RepID=UPI000260DFD8|nr:heavy metal-associated domain-containing protein [Rhodanobacter sp. 115]EIL86809.1 heavy metal translocating P-type ATPase [Rhodanobacter sp. 115]ODT95131.1 MAG: copper resistance protein CopZ [Rhodanobacter sp. SCN 67-45]OJW45474.1 MAG: copper resistance protein CopZ [Rhodanobacter sp. 67-28]TAM41340.1 MAG: heavy-metal-associated domain-containing protein [Rhodanobacter sp.]
MTERIDFTVTGDEKIHCSGCETRIRFALQRLPGVQHVTADAGTQRVVVAFDQVLLTASQIRERLNELGFHVEVLS